MLSRSLTGNKVAPAPLEGSEASPAPAVADAAVSEGQSAVDRTSAGPADGACRPDTVNAPVPQSLPSVAHPAIQPSLPSRQQSLPARQTLLSAKSGISWPEDAKEGGSKPLAVSRVPKGRAQRFFPSATAVDKVRQLSEAVSVQLEEDTSLSVEQLWVARCASEGFQEQTRLVPICRVASSPSVHWQPYQAQVLMARSLQWAQYSIRFVVILVAS